MVQTKSLARKKVRAQMQLFIQIESIRYPPSDGVLQRYNFFMIRQMVPPEKKPLSFAGAAAFLLTVYSDYTLFGGEYLYPVIVGIVDKVEPHRFVFETDAAHLFVKGSHLVVVALDPHTQVTLVLAQFIGLSVVAQPGELDQERRHAVGKIDQNERAVGSLFSLSLGKSQSLVIEGNATVEVGHVYIEVVEF